MAHELEPQKSAPYNYRNNLKIIFIFFFSVFNFLLNLYMRCMYLQNQQNTPKENINLPANMIKFDTNKVEFLYCR